MLQDYKIIKIVNIFIFHMKQKDGPFMMLPALIPCISFPSIHKPPLLYTIYKFAYLKILIYSSTQQ